MKILSQRNPMWATARMGKTSWTLGRIGCLTVCISMLSDYFGGYLDPKELATMVLSYTPEGKLLWNSAKTAKFKFIERFRGRNEDLILSAIEDPKRAVVLELDGGAHWVVVLRKIGPLFWIADPWDGRKKFNFRTITGGAIFQSNT